MARAEQVLAEVRAERRLLPRVDMRKLLHKITPRQCAQGVRCGRTCSSPFCAVSACLCPAGAALSRPPTHTTAFVHPNLVKDVPKPMGPNQRYVSDITYLPTRQGTVYLSLVKDAYSRKIVGAHVHSSLQIGRTGASRAPGQGRHSRLHSKMQPQLKSICADKLPHYGPAYPT